MNSSVRCRQGPLILPLVSSTQRPLSQEAGTVSEHLQCCRSTMTSGETCSGGTNFFRCGMALRHFSRPTGRPRIPSICTQIESGMLGLGAFFQGEWLQSRWPAWVRDQKPAIEYLEPVPILFPVIVWGKTLFGKKVIFHCDNQGATLAWENLGSTNTGVLDLMRRILMMAARGNFNVTPKHIAGIYNGTADACSRFQEKRFRSLAPMASRAATECPNIFPDLRRTYGPSETTRSQPP